MTATLWIVLALVCGSAVLAIAWILALKRASDAAINAIGPTAEQMKEKTDSATAKVAVEVTKEEEEIRNASSAKLIDMARALREHGRMRK